LANRNPDVGSIPAAIGAMNASRLTGHGVLPGCKSGDAVHVARHHAIATQDSEPEFRGFFRETHPADSFCGRAKRPYSERSPNALRT